MKDVAYQTMNNQAKLVITSVAIETPLHHTNKKFLQITHAIINLQLMIKDDRSATEQKNS